MISIEAIPLDYVLENDEKKLNTNNHWIDGKKPDDYHTVIEENYTKNWVDLFHKEYRTIILYKKDLIWMYEAFNIGKQTQIFSALYEEDMIDFLERYREETKSIFDGRKYFIRTDRVSLKNGIHKVGPYTNLRNIIESMVTTVDAHKCFLKDDMECTIYLFPWIEDINPNKEFRIFVYNDKITAISQQHLYDVNSWLNKMSREDIILIINKILEFFENKIKHLYKKEKYVMDLVLIGKDNKPYFIEPNPFGEQYPSGSALFHWINDRDIIHGIRDLTLRYVSI